MKLGPLLRFVRRYEGAAWAIALAMLLAFFMYRNEASLGEAVKTARRAKPVWVIVGLALATGVQVGMVHTLWLIARRLHPGVSWLRVGRAHLQRIAFGTLSPVPGPSVVAFARTLRPAGVSTDNALLALTINSVVGHGSFVLYLIPTLILLQVQHRVVPLLMLAGALLILISAAFVVLAALMFRSSGPPQWLAARSPQRLRDFFETARAHHIRGRDLVVPLATALAVEFAGAGIFFASLRALGDPASLSVAVAAYGVATLFLLVAPFFSGLGIVEVGAVVVLQQFGVPPGIALGSTILYRVAELWMPLAFAVSFEIGSHNQVRSSSVHVPAIMAAVAGATSMLSAASIEFGERIHRYGDQVGLPLLSRSFSLLAGALLVYVAYNLWHRRRSAWVVAVVLLGALIPAHLVKDRDSVAAAISGFALLLLLVHARRFTVRSDLPTLGRGLTQLLIAVVVVMVYGTLGFYFLDARAFGVEFSLDESVLRSVRTAYLFSSGLHPRNEYGEWFLDSLGLLGASSLVFAALSIARPVVERRRVPPTERDEARQLIQACGGSSLDFFKYSSDKRFFFGSRRKGVISYGLSGGTAVALGDPVVPDEGEFKQILDEWLDLGRRNGWRLAFHQVGPRWLYAYSNARLSSVKIGEEAIVNLDTFSISGNHMKAFRSAVNRLKRDGYSVRSYEPPLDDELVEALREVSDTWLHIGNRRERQFTLGHFDEEYLRACRVFTIEDHEGTVYAFANIVFDGVPGEATIDLMRRREEPDGAMDVLFVGMFEALRSEGYHAFSLGMAPLANVGTGESPGAIERTLHQLYERGDRLFSYRGLRAYKEKFHPNWEPRYTIYETEAHLPFIVVAIGRLTE